MKTSCSISATDLVHDSKLLHSIHNTGHPSTKVALVSSSNYDDAIGQFYNITNILINHIPEEYHPNVFYQNANPTVSGPCSDSISACNYSSFASDLLTAHLPVHQATNSTPGESVKRFRTTHITYAKVAPTSTISSQSTVTLPTLDSSKFDKFFDSISQKLNTTHGSKINIEDLEEQVKSTSITTIKQSGDNIGVEEKPYSRMISIYEKKYLTCFTLLQMDNDYTLLLYYHEGFFPA
jgi:hypothetical protein